MHVGGIIVLSVWQQLPYKVSIIPYTLWILDPSQVLLGEGEIQQPPPPLCMAPSVPMSAVCNLDDSDWSDHFLTLCRRRLHCSMTTLHLSL